LRIASFAKSSIVEISDTERGVRSPGAVSLSLVRVATTRRVHALRVQQWPMRDRRRQNSSSNESSSESRGSRRVWTGERSAPFVVGACRVGASSALIADFAFESMLRPLFAVVPSVANADVTNLRVR